MSAFVQNEKNDLIYMTSPVIVAKHAFSTRFGGVSEDGLASLNLGFNRGDVRERVIENYRLLGAALGIDVMRAAYTKQVHGTHVRLVTDADRCGPTDPAHCDSDGLVTNVAGLPIFCFTADCVPLLLHDPAGGTAGAVHCGWRSSVSDIPGVAVGLMRSLGSRPGDIRAAIGPAIGYCCFETDADVPEAVERWLGGDTEGLIRRKDLPGKYLVDLRGALRRRLIQLGLSPEHIAVSDECTRCLHDKYWSHRYTRGGPRGSQCAVICL